MFDEFWHQMSVKDYVFDASEMQDGSICALAIIENEQDFLLMGNSFLRGYYSIHDMQDGYIGFVPHKTSEKHFLFQG
jgi:hypothetical protein